MSYNSVNIQDEIDLLELWRAICRGKWLVLLMFIIFSFATTVYLFSKKTTYQAKLTLVSPISTDLSLLNIGRSFNSVLKPVNTADAYIIFRGVLLADSSLLFFKKQNTLKERGVISIAVKPYQLGNSVIVEASSKQAAIEVVKEFVALVDRIAIDKLNTTLIQEKNNALAYLKNQMQEVQKSAFRDQQAQLIRLKEALQIAQAIHLENPSPVTNYKSYSDLSNPAYLRGSKALAAEIYSIENRSSNAAFNTKLQELKAEYALVQETNTTGKNISLARADGELVLAETDTGFNKKRTIVLAGLIGGLLGVFLIVLQQIKMLKRHD